MDNFEKRQAVTAELLHDSGRSDRLVAEKLGKVVSPGLVRKVRRKLEQEGKLRPGKRLGRDGKRRGKGPPSMETLQVILGSVATGELTIDEAATLLRKEEVHPGMNLREILEAVPKGDLLPVEAAALFVGGRSWPDEQPQSFH